MVWTCKLIYFCSLFGMSKIDMMWREGTFAFDYGVKAVAPTEWLVYEHFPFFFFFAMFEAEQVPLFLGN